MDGGGTSRRRLHRGGMGFSGIFSVSRFPIFPTSVSQLLLFNFGFQLFQTFFLNFYCHHSFLIKIANTSSVFFNFSVFGIH